MQKQLKRTLTLLLLLALLLGIVPTGSAFRAYAAETETVAAETEETTEVSAAAEEPTPEFEEETGPCEEPIPEEESKPAEENEAPREIDPGEGEATGTIVELEQIQPRDEVLASSYGYYDQFIHSEDLRRWQGRWNHVYRDRQQRQCAFQRANRPFRQAKCAGFGNWLDSNCDGERAGQLCCRKPHTNRYVESRRQHRNLPKHPSGNSCPEQSFGRRRRRGLLLQPLPV